MRAGQNAGGMVSSIRAHAGIFVTIQPESCKARREGTRRLGSLEMLLSGKTSCTLKVEGFAEEEGSELRRTSKRGASFIPSTLQAGWQRSSFQLNKRDSPRNLFFCLRKSLFKQEF